MGVVASDERPLEIAQSGPRPSPYGQTLARSGHPAQNVTKASVHQRDLVAQADEVLIG